MNITLKQLQAFCAVAQYQTLGAAAERLFLTKGALSQAIKELESQLGLQLFDRVHPRLYLNHEGQRLLPLADELLLRAGDISLLFTSDTKEHYLRIGCSNTIGNYMMPELLRSFEDACSWLPDVHIANTHEICSMLGSFSLDLALLEGEEAHFGLICTPWLADEMIVVAGKNHPLPEGVPLPISALQGERWILREASSGSREYFNNYLAPLLKQYSVVLDLSSAEAIIGAVAQGLGITFTSRLTVEQTQLSSRLKIISLEQEFPRRFSLCYHPKKYHSASMRMFIEYCQKWHPKQTKNAGKKQG